VCRGACRLSIHSKGNSCSDLDRELVLIDPAAGPIKLLRFFVAVFFTLFYVSALGVFIISFDCNVEGMAWFWYT